MQVNSSKAASSPLWPSSGAAASNRPPQHPDNISQHGADILRRAGRGGAPSSDALASAADKLGRFGERSAEFGVDSAVALVMVEQCKEMGDKARTAKIQIKARFTKLKQQNKEQLQQIKKRIEARRKAAKWGLLAKIFKAIGAALSAASSIFTGPVGIAGAALLVASLVVSLTVKGDVGQWVGLGLSLAAAAVTLGSSIIGEAAKGAMKVAQKALEVSAQCSDIASHGSGVGKGTEDKKALEAQAELMEIKAMVAKLIRENDDDREEIEEVIEAQSRCTDQVLKILETTNQTTLAATAV